MQKWKYCLLGSFKGVEDGLYPYGISLTFFEPDGQRTEYLQYDRDDRPGQMKKVAECIYNLGLEGWEMVETISDGDRHSLYFKRPIG